MTSYIIDICQVQNISIKTILFLREYNTNHTYGFSNEHSVMVERLFGYSSSIPSGNKGIHHHAMREINSPTIMKLDIYSN
jgi:hypothetical protein